MRQRPGKGGVQSSRYCYVYCIIPTRKPCYFRLKGMDGAELRVIHFKDIAAVVSDPLDKKYELLDDGMIHEIVVEGVQKEFTVLPMGFGQVSTEQDVKAFLNKNHSQFKQMLKKLDGKKELGIKVMWDMKSVLREIVSSSNQIRKLQKKLSSQAEDVAYHTKMEIGRIVEERLEKMGGEISSEIIRRLNASSENYTENMNFTSEMLLNAAFLVKNEKEEEFDRAVDEIDQQYRHLVRIKYVTSPPYNFASLRIGR